MSLNTTWHSFGRVKSEAEIKLSKHKDDRLIVINLTWVWYCGIWCTAIKNDVVKYNQSLGRMQLEWPNVASSRRSWRNRKYGNGGEENTAAALKTGDSKLAEKCRKSSLF